MTGRPRDPQATHALAYLEALAISCGFPSPLPLGSRDAAELRAAAGVIRRLMGDGRDQRKGPTGDA